MLRKCIVFLTGHAEHKARGAGNAVRVQKRARAKQGVVDTAVHKHDTAIVVQSHHMAPVEHVCAQRACGGALSGGCCTLALQARFGRWTARAAAVDHVP